MIFDKEDKENIFELAESLKQKHGIKNIKFHYEDLPKLYWYMEMKKYCACNKEIKEDEILCKDCERLQI